MKEYTFLTDEQCVGNNKLDIIEKRGAVALITDFSVLLGGAVMGEGENRIGWYWTKSDGVDNTVSTIDEKEYIFYEEASARYMGARPVLPFSSIDKIPTNGKKRKKGRR